MTGRQIAICDRAVAPDPKTGVAPEWVHLFPMGKMRGRDGRKFDLSDPDMVVAAFASNGADLPVDYEHQNDKPKSGPVRAAGWIKELRATANGLWGRVAWTATAAAMIGAKEYRYLSPSFLHLKDGTIVAVKGAGLVHNPNLHLTALAAQEDTMADPETTKPDGRAARIMRRLAEMLKLPVDTEDDDVFAALEKAFDAQPDPEKFVPIEAMAEALRDRNTQVATMAQSSATAKVEDAMRRGYISPAMKGWATSLCMQNADSFDAFLEKSGPRFAHLFEPSRLSAAHFSRSEPSPDTGLAATVCWQLGLAPGTLSS